MEFDTAECEFPGCHENDFLLTSCSCCKRRYCQAHAATTAHRCAAQRSEPTVSVCPMCSVVVRVEAGESMDFAVNRHIERECHRGGRAPSHAAQRGTAPTTLASTFGPAGHGASGPSTFGSGAASFAGSTTPQQQQYSGFGGGAAALSSAATQRFGSGSTTGFGGSGAGSFGGAAGNSASGRYACACSQAGCTNQAPQPFRCEHCARDFCLTHRTPEAHSCAPFMHKQQHQRAMQAVAAGQRLGGSSSGGMRMIPGPVKYANTPSTPFTTRPGRVPEQGDLLIAVFFDASVTTSATGAPASAPTPAPFFLSIAANTVMGRLLDACCSLATPIAVRNDNGEANRPATDMLHVYAAHLGKAVHPMGSTASTWCRDPATLRPSEIAGAFVILRGASPIPAALPQSLMAAAGAGAAANARTDQQQPRSCHATAVHQQQQYQQGHHQAATAASTAYAHQYYGQQRGQQYVQPDNCAMC